MYRRDSDALQKVVINMCAAHYAAICPHIKKTTSIAARRLLHLADDTLQIAVFDDAKVDSDCFVYRICILPCDVAEDVALFGDGNFTFAFGANGQYHIAELHL